MTTFTERISPAVAFARPNWRGARPWLAPLAVYGLFLGVALLLSLWRIGSSGAMWPDDPRYLNAAAMIHDWFFSGHELSPMQFAMQDYAKYPGFSIPYHPPIYPGFLAVWFSLTGISYESARVFVALLFAGGGMAIYTIVHRITASRSCAIWSALLLMLSPEVARWARSTMSEIPALTFSLLGTAFFIHWCKSKKPWHCFAAFLFAECAFLSRVTAAGILPTWFIYLLFTQGWRPFKSYSLALSTLCYLVINYFWVKFVAQFATYELNTPGETYKAVQWLSWDHLSFYPVALPALVGWVTVFAAIAGAIFSWKSRPSRDVFLFGFIWFLSYYVFQLFLLFNEQRMFLFALPGVCIMAAAPLASCNASSARNYVWQGCLALALALGLWHISQLPQGVVGHQAVASHLASSKEKGNVMLCTWVDQDLIFRYRAIQGATDRSLIRADRTLSIRVPDYTRKESTIIAQNAQEVLKIIKDGRIRFLVTCTPDDELFDARDFEMKLAHQTASEQPESFELERRFPLVVDFGEQPRRSTVHVWRYKGKLEEGPSQLPVVIPTAKMVITP